MAKYRIREIAADFDVAGKDIMKILSEHFGEAKRTSVTSLEEAELDIIFETYTRDYSVESFDEYFATANQTAEEEKEKESETETEKSAEKKSEPEAKDKAKEKAPAKDKKPVQKAEAPKKKNKDPNAVPQSRVKGEVRTVNTRANNVDLEKYNERYENIAYKCQLKK